MFIVVADHPYYPEVVVCKTEELAKIERKNFIESLGGKDGSCDLIIYIAEIISQDNLKSYY